MEIKIIIVLLLVSLSLTFFQDLKHRTIHILLPIIILILSLSLNYISPTLNYINTLQNIGFIIINILGLFVYFSLKKRELYNPIDKSIGLGDILFFIAITPLFYIHKFILFFILGLLFSLFGFLILSVKSKNKTIPLAGFLSLFLIIILGTQAVFNINLVDL